ncbi:acyl transferase/acyl hydrolase/lysophospholipase [Pyronema domesticum]|nr:acyl transferase/acyl hydrolase/lysophospholipase [Pyronema domesticum]
MSTEEALDAYTELSSTVFTKKKWRIQHGSYKVTKLQEAIEKIVEKYGDTHDPNEIMLNTRQDCCKTAIATPSLGLTLFRTHESQPLQIDALCKIPIWQAARATTAASTFFKPMLIGRSNAEISYVDGAMGHNNPIKAVLEEAETACDHSGSIESQNIEYITSIGTGMPQNVSLKAPSIIERALVPINTVRAIVRIITDANDVAEKMEKHFSMMPGVYFRLNVGQGLQVSC